jgi:hypothetical protein
MSIQDNTLEPDPADVDRDAQVLKDIKLLERAAKEWRWLAWLWLIGGTVMSAPLIIKLLLDTREVLRAPNAAGLRHVQHEVAGLLAVFLFFGLVSSFYFLLARRIARCQRWAVGLALFIAGVGAAATVAGITVRLIHHRVVMAHMVMEGVMLLAHLNLLRVLFRSYGAVLRIRRQAVAGLDEDTALP